jgi:hypothetical protein
VIRINIDIQSIIEEFSLSPQQVIELQDYTVKEITARYASELENEANRSLKSARQQYIASIVVADEGIGKGSVSLVGWLPNAMEQGMESFDMKPGFLNGPNAKQGKNGKYNTIPFSQGTPGALAENFSNIMPEEVYQVVKEKPVNPTTGTSKGLESGDIPAPFDQPEKKSVQIPKSKTFVEYEHKNSIYEGLRKKQDKVTGQNSYESFRRVSENSDPAAWIHPGFDKIDLMGKVLDEFDVPSEVSNIVTSFLS